MSNLETPQRERRGRDNVTLQKPRLILAEGSDEQGLASAYLKHLQLDEFQVHDMGGKNTPWERDISTITLSDGFENLTSLGIILDADGDYSAAWDKCRYALERSGLTAPDSEGTASSGSPRCSIFVSPGGGKNGALEDLVLKTLPSASLHCVDQYFTCVGLSGATPKQRLLAACSGLDGKARSISVAARRGVLDLESEALQGLRQFLESLA